VLGVLGRERGRPGGMPRLQSSGNRTSSGLFLYVLVRLGLLLLFAKLDVFQI